MKNPADFSSALPYHVRIVKDMQQLLEAEPDQQKQATAVLLLMVSFALHYAYDDVVHARGVINDLHGQALHLMLQVEAEKTPMAKEIWRPVVDWEDAYEVSDQGRVRSLERDCPHVAGSRKVAARLMKMTPRYSDADRLYFVVSLNRGGVAAQPYVHHLVLEAFVSPRPDGAQGRHLNRNTTDNRLKNLIWKGRSRRPPLRGGTTQNQKAIL